MPTLGRGSWIGFAEETTWGTAVSRTNFLSVVSNGLQRTTALTPRSDLKGSSGSAMRRGHFKGFEEAGGSVVVLATYENIGMLCKHSLGTLNTTGAGPYTHTYTLATTLPTGLTMEGKRGTSGAEVFEGCKVSTATWECSSGSEMTLSLDVIAETAATRSASSSPTFVTGERVLHHHSSTLSFDGQTYDLVSFKCTLNNSIARRNFLGSRVTKEPARSDYSSVQMDLSVEAADALYTALHAGTTGDAVVTFASGTKSMAFTLHNAYLTGASDPISGAGIVQQSLTLVGESDGTDEGLKLVVINDAASGTAN